MCIPACPVSGVENMSEGRAAVCRSLPRGPDCHQRLGSFAAHEWEPLSVMTCHLGTRGRERCSLDRPGVAARCPDNGGGMNGTTTGWYRLRDRQLAYGASIGRDRTTGVPQAV